ncbi:hypothetical protein PENSPDRAFT_666200 [Peniophora sp. CONT]|nr:hypothetical protein PENSPDRAFT_666200 [Peniophora sp. CONT]
MSASKAQTIRDARGCYHCRCMPSSPGWTPHMARNCPGDPARNIPPVTASVSAVTLEFVDATAAAIAAYNPEVDDCVGGMAPSAVLNVASVQLPPGEPVPVDQADFWNVICVAYRPYSTFGIWVCTVI